jgi:hypothetical protein
MTQFTSPAPTRGCPAVATVFGLVLALILMLTGCGTASAPATGAHAQPVATSQPINITSLADTMQFHTPQELCAAPFPIVEVIVESVGAGAWNTPGGVRPAVGERDVVQQGYMIYTPMTFARVTVLRNTPQLSIAPQQIVMMGGTAGQDQIHIAPFPQLQVGGQYVLILSPSRDRAAVDNGEHRLIVGQAFPVDAQGNVLLKPQVVEQGQISQQELKVTLVDLVRQLNACA